MKQFFCAILALLSCTALALPIKEGPTKVMVLVFDQMRPDYIERFDLKNFKRLQKMGRNFSNSYVGHLGSLTIVSHAVISTGFLPKQLPWVDDVMVDKKGLLGKPGANYETTHLSQDQILKLMKTLPQSELLVTRIKEKTKLPVIAIGEKNYAAITMGGPTADRIITMGRADKKCVPAGIEVPDYIARDPRYEVECSEKYGTELSFYPLDGNHYYPGKDLKHMGGDVWTADIALEVMRHESWGGLFVTFGAIDKFAHMLGEPDGIQQLGFESPAHLEEIAHIADDQLGRILDELVHQKLLEKTLIVVTADHGGQTDSIYLGNGEAQTITEEEEKTPGCKPIWMKRLASTNKIKNAYLDTSIRIWLKEESSESADQVIRFMKEIPQITRIFELRKNKAGDYYYSESFNQLKKQSPKFRSWAIKHDVELLNTMASSQSPNIVGLLADNVGFGKLGDHGGAQESVQRIPMIIAGPGVKKGLDTKPIRLFELNEYITKAMSLKKESF